MTVGREEIAASAAQAGATQREGRRAGRYKNTGPLIFETPRWKWSYAAARFAPLACVFCGTGGFAALALSLAVDSCLTLAAMASVSTL